MDMTDPNDYEDMRFSTDTEFGNVYPEEISPGVYEHTYWKAYLAESEFGPWISIAIRRKSDMAEPSEADPQKFSLKIDISRDGFTPKGQRWAGKKKLNPAPFASVTDGNYGLIKKWIGSLRGPPYGGNYDVKYEAPFGPKAKAPVKLDLGGATTRPAGK